MTELYFAKDGNRLAPADEEAEEALSHVGGGEIVALKLVKQRNPKFNRKYRALVRAAFDAAGGRYRSPQDLHVELKIRCGHYHEHLTALGEIVYIPDSTAFDSMDETTFATFYDDAIRRICTEIVPDLDEQNLRKFLEGTW